MVRCPHCGTEVDVWQEPMSQQTRAADEHGPRTFVIIGGGWLMHRCVIGNDPAEGGTGPATPDTDQPGSTG